MSASNPEFSPSPEEQAPLTLRQKADQLEEAYKHINLEFVIPDTRTEYADRHYIGVEDKNIKHCVDYLIKYLHSPIVMGDMEVFGNDEQRDILRNEVRQKFGDDYRELLQNNKLRSGAASALQNYVKLLSKSLAVHPEYLSLSEEVKAVELPVLSNQEYRSLSLEERKRHVLDLDEAVKKILDILSRPLPIAGHA